MRNIFLALTLIAGLPIALKAQETVYPAKAQKGLILIKNGTIHMGNGQVIPNGSILIKEGKIEKVATNIEATSADQIIDAVGQHIYPGLILSQSQLGLVEVPTVRASSDANEIGEMNSNVRSIVAYNTDSKVINTLRTNGILLAQVSPEGSLITGSSSVVQLDAWNWEDAAYATDNGIHFQMPSMLARRMGRGFMFAQQATGDPVKMALEQVEKVKEFLRDAKAYAAVSSHTETNLKLQAVKGLFTHQQKLYVHCDIVKEMLVAIDFVKEFGIDVVIVGGADSWQIADLLKQYNVAVILSQMHNLPAMVDDDIDQPYKTPSILQKSGVLYAINDDDGNTRSRNLAFNAGTAAAYGLSKEEALTAITLNPAKILGIADRTGSIEVGKDANIVISKGDILDMKSSVITRAFIQGRIIEMTDKHKQLADRYAYKYGQ